MPYMLFVLLDFAYNLLHFTQHFWIVVIIDIALKEFQYIQPITLVLYKGGKEHIESVVYRDKLIPIFCPSTQCIFKRLETLLPKIPFFRSQKDVMAGKASTIESDTDSC